MDKKSYKDIKENLTLFLKDYLLKSGARNFVLGVSGGLDSAVVATLCSIAMPKNTHALLMPTKYSNKKNMQDAINLCKGLNLKYKIINIQSMLDVFTEQIGENLDRTRVGNLSARVRMSLLYDYSAKENALVVGTSNKSEIMLGYGTIYGDMACALNPIGSLYKSEIFEFAKFLKIDEDIINKAPSADLWDGQSDEADLGYSYAVLDEVLNFIDKNGENEPLIYEKFNQNLANSVLKRVKANKFKREMPKIAEV